MIILMDVMDADGVTWVVSMETGDKVVMKNTKYKGEEVWKPTEELFDPEKNTWIKDLRVVLPSSSPPPATSQQG